MQLAPDIAARSVVGHVALTLATDRQGPLQLDAGEGLSIDSISERGQPLRFNRGGGVSTVDLPPASAGVGERVVDVRYHGMPASGMRFLPALR